jgi:hypothetical protein
LPSEGERLSSSNTIGSVWIAPAALARLKTGQVLDEDQYTRVRYSVVRVTRDEVVLLDAGPTESTQQTYEIATGMLVGQRVTQQVGAARIVTQMQLKSRS